MTEARETAGVRETTGMREAAHTVRDRSGRERARSPLRPPTIVTILAIALSVACEGRGDTRAPADSHHGEIPASDPGEYRSAILRWRGDRDAFFKFDARSPFPPGRRAGFVSQYYPIDPTWRLRLPLLEYEVPQPVVLVTSSGERRTLEKRGHVEFVRDGVPVSLQLYRDPAEGAPQGTFWVPFVDAGARNGETYPAGRYLDAEQDADGSVTLDFNLAYNPYCAYGLDYSCPITPRENHLAIPVRAGEKGFPHD